MVKVKEITSDFQNKKSRINRDFFQNVLLQAEDYKNLQMTLKKYIYSKKRINSNRYF
jgi:ribosomal protein S18